jgi:NAD(P)-dependent dehydrogenase (short-subunit alcohol dehydrogenase family)
MALEVGEEALRECIGRRGERNDQVTVQPRMQLPHRTRRAVGECRDRHYRDTHTGIWDALGEDGKRDHFQHLGTANPARRIGTVEDIAGALLFAMTSTFVTGLTLRVDGGEPLT